MALSAAKIWQVAALGLFLHSIGGGISGQCCGNICGNCLENCDRAKGMLICESLAAGILGMIGPMISGWVLVSLMHVEGAPTDPNQVRPLFIICVVIAVISLFMVIFHMDFANGGLSHRKKNNILKDGIDILKANKNCRKWIIIGAIGGMPASLVTPYLSLFAKEAKGADVAILSLMTSAIALTSVLCGYLFGIISDKVGRKPVLFVTIGLYLAGLAILITTNNPKMLVLVGILFRGFQEIGATLSASIGQEIITDKLRGRFMGICRLSTAFVSAVLAGVLRYYLG